MGHELSSSEVIEVLEMAESEVVEQEVIESEISELETSTLEGNEPETPELGTIYSLKKTIPP